MVCCQFELLTLLAAVLTLAAFASGSAYISRRRRFSLRALFGFMVVAALISLVARCAYIALPRIVPVESPSNYPHCLLDVSIVAEESGIAIEQLKVVTLEHGWSDEYWWQMKASPELIDLHITHWNLSPMAKTDQTAHWLWKNMPPSWSVANMSQMRFYSTAPYYPDGGFAMMHDKVNQRLYFYYLDDF